MRGSKIFGKGRCDSCGMAKTAGNHDCPRVDSHGTLDEACNCCAVCRAHCQYVANLEQKVIDQAAQISALEGRL